ncbi:hypothetical protein ElyMa_000600200, partial [Elysia marginata]
IVISILYKKKPSAPKSYEGGTVSPRIKMCAHISCYVVVVVVVVVVIVVVVIVVVAV